MTSMQCPNCGWFLSNCYCYLNNNGDVAETHGTCKRCGHVHPTDWVYEDWDTTKKEKV